MFQFLADKLGAGALIVSQLLLTAVVGTDPYFQEVELEVSGDRLYCSARLVESFTPDLDMLLQSGDTVTIHFEVDLLNSQTDSIVALSDWNHQFQYSILEDDYTVYRAEDDHTVRTTDFEEARQEWVKIDRSLFCRMRVMEDHQKYYLRISAYMEEMEMPGVTKKVNLMSYWNRIRPVHISEPFMKRQLAQ
ncbi:MAG: DUF4390 domain-containing protein [Candidatus Marinimicrobia bacterium]|nr:DUF4390 domain-containing protein [Candidatus Neomarinimicrobiota bacterium]